MNEKNIISVTGLGYVGLPVALAFAHKYHVIGFDHNAQRIELLRQGIDPSNEMTPDDFAGTDIFFTAEPDELRKANFHIVAVPTPINASHTPDIALLREAMTILGQRLKKGDTVVIESTVYPCCTEEDCLPILEKESGLKVDTDFGLAYSPERINPGDHEHSLSSVVKVVAAHDESTLATVRDTYASIIDAGVYVAPSIKVAEAAKIIENTQRDINIALMNELSLIFRRMDIETSDVIAAASTKWNFLPFRPGLVGGHCIGVDPYYLDYKASELGYHTQMISSGRFVNDSMGRYVAKQTVKMIAANGFDVKHARVLLMGVTYKENVTDVRNSRSIDIIDELRSFSVESIDVWDPVASAAECERNYGFVPLSIPEGKYEAIIVAVAHDAFRLLERDFFDAHLTENGILSDVHGLFRHKCDGICAWRL